ncbi:hypothetical protein KFE25_004999 [Diacronema lutheri]|uniref:ATP-dependent transporter ycf16 n=3 Tax=Diacronema lutheri TaxID=2081491 RepID=A0A8J5XBG0_DIALT|nr:hypothetical protein KFE25_004999 [Diacronema lutheri]
MSLAAASGSFVRYVDVPEWVHDLVFAPVFLALVLAVCVHRARSLSTRFGGGADPRRRALLADFAAGDEGEPERAAVPALQRAEQAASLALAAVSAAVLAYAALPSTAGTALASERRVALVGAACTTASWAACAWLVFREAASDKQPCRSLRLWWILAVLPRTLQLRTDVLALEALGDGGARDSGSARARARGVLLALRVASYVPALFLGGCGLFQMDSWTRPAAGGGDGGGAHAPPPPSFPLPPAPAGGAATMAPTAGVAARPRLAGDEVASFWDRLTFRWCNVLLVLGAARPLEHADLFATPAVSSAVHNQRLLEASWRQQQLRTPRGGAPSFLAALFRTYGLYFCATGLLKLVNDGAVFIGPLMIARITAFIEGSTSEPIETVYGYTAVLFLGATIQSLAIGQYFQRGYILSLRARAGIGQAVYRKALSLSYEAKARFGVGAIVSFMQIDAAKLGDAFPYLHLIWSAWVQVVLATAMLWAQVGPAGLAGVLVLTLLMPLNTKVAKMQMSLTKRTMAARDRRVKFTNEVVSGMRILKFFAWEPSFAQAVGRLRDAELAEVRRNAILGAFSTFLWGATPLFVTVATFIVYVLLGNELTASKAFTSLSLFNVLRFPLNAIPSSITRVVDVLVVCRRLGDFFAAPEVSEYRCATDAEWARALELRRQGYNRYMAPPPPPPPGAGAPLARPPPARAQAADGAPGAADSGADGDALAEWEQPVLILDECDFAWPPVARSATGARARAHGPAPPASAASALSREASAGGAALAHAPTLRGIDLRVRPRTLTIVAGPVGSGKSSLLSALTNEIPLVRGHVAVRGRVAFCAQEAWIQNLSFRDNVLFGEPFDAERYAAVVAACALGADIASLPAGDSTEIGERGINLSGGQKARVALARACYARADVYLLDDVLSAVDAEVGMHIVNECVSRLLADKTIILVTHHTQWLRLAHSGVLMRDGVIEAQGSPAQLVAAGHIEPAAAGLGGCAPAAGAPSAGARANGGGAGAGANGGGASAVAGDEGDGGSARAPVRAAPPEPAGSPRKQPPAADGGAHGSVAAVGASAGAPPAPPPGPPAHGRIIAAEGRERGRVKLHVWRLYLLALGARAIGSLIVLYSLSQALQLGSSAWLSVWAGAGARARAGGPAARSAEYYVAVYSALTLGAAATVYARALVVALASVEAGRRLHASALGSVMRSPMAFFEATPIGQILNRFSGDLQVVDVQLRATTQQLFLCLFNIVGILTIVLYAAPYVGLALLPIALLYANYAHLYRCSSREITRLDSVSKSPIYAGFAESLHGASTISAYEKRSEFVNRSAALFDSNLRAYFVSFSINRWLGVRLEFLGNSFTGLAALLCVFEAHAGRMSAGTAGLSLSYSLVLTDYLNWLIRVFTTLETQMVAVERIDSYCRLDAEQPPAALQLAPPSGWPSAGRLSLDGVCMRYRPNLPLVLHSLSCQIEAGEHVGIVGRTGSGKTSLLLALYRIVPLSAGCIRIDGIDISSLDLQALRSALSIIPQDPVLFSGTVRSNLDPFSEHSDVAVWDALRRCRLFEVVEANEHGLAMPVEGGGLNLSVGQRQLLCLGRALLRSSRVLVLDEATASIDHSTDQIIQETLKRDCAGRTTLTIAHRLHTILGADRVLVMAAGKVVESGPPAELAQIDGGVFASLLQRAQAVHEVDDDEVQ